jgi:hypothetical protein
MMVPHDWGWKLIERKSERSAPLGGGLSLNFRRAQYGLGSPTVDICYHARSACKRRLLGLHLGRDPVDDLCSICIIGGGCPRVANGPCGRSIRGRSALACRTSGPLRGDRKIAEPRGLKGEKLP